MVYWRILSMRCGLLYNHKKYMKRLPLTTTMRRSALSLAGLLVILALLAACAAESTPTATPEPATPTPATPIATVVPSRPLTICLGQEPASLFPVDNPSSADAGHPGGRL